MNCTGARSVSVLYALLAIVIVAPFERPLLVVPGGFILTTVESVVIGAGALIAARLGLRRLVFGGPTPLAVVGGLFLLTLLIAALAAPADSGNALRFVARMIVAAVLFVLTLRVVSTQRHAIIVAFAMLVVASCVAAVAVLEAAQVPAVMKALTVFRPGFHVVGGQLRATSTLFYPTITSMYLEIAFAWGLWLLLQQAGGQVGRWAGRDVSFVTQVPSAPSPLTRLSAPTRLPAYLPTCLIFTALVVIGAGITATFTRAGLIGMAVALVMIAVLRLTRVPRAQAGLGRLTALAATLVAIVFFSHPLELLATRVTTEGSQAWYGAQYQVPAALELTTGQGHRVPIRVANTGRIAWDSAKEPPFFMAYHWLRGESDEVVQFEGVRTSFPRAIVPGRAVAFEADVIAPGQPGTYTLVWDVVHETRAWLSTEGVAPARTRVTVRGAPVTAVATTMSRLPTASVTPKRPALWSAAVAMAADRPWLGVGPDNYRHNYGRYLRLTEWNHRVHANNMYLEVLAGAGIAGCLALVVLVAAAGTHLWRRVQQSREEHHTATLAAFAVWVVVAGHGLVDSFLSFTTTYVMFAIAAGVAFSPGLIAACDAAQEDSFGFADSTPADGHANRL